MPTGVTVRGGVPSLSTAIHRSRPNRWRTTAEQMTSSPRSASSMAMRPSVDRTMVLAGDVGVVRRVGDDHGQIELRALGGVVDRSQISSARSKCWAASTKARTCSASSPARTLRQRLGHPVRARQCSASSVAAVRRPGSGRRAGLGQRQVQRGPLAGEEVGVRGLLQQRVAEGVAVGVLDGTCWRQGLAQRLHQAGSGRPATPRAGGGSSAGRPRRPRAARRARRRQRLQPQVQDVAQTRRSGPRPHPTPRAAPQRRRRSLGRACSRATRSGAAASPRMPATCSASSACEKAPTSRRSTTARAPPRPGTGAAGSGGAARRCGTCRPGAGARRARPARGRRGTRASSGRPSGCPRRRRGRATPRRDGRGALGGARRGAPADASPVALMPSPGSSAERRRAQLRQQPREVAAGGPDELCEDVRLESRAARAARRRSARRGGRRRRGQAVAAQHAHAAGQARRSSSRSSRVLPTPGRRRRRPRPQCRPRPGRAPLRGARAPRPPDELGARDAVGTFALCSPPAGARGRFTRVPGVPGRSPGGARPRSGRRAPAPDDGGQPELERSSASATTSQTSRARSNCCAASAKAEARSASRPGLHGGRERLGQGGRRMPVMGQLGRGRRAREGRVVGLAPRQAPRCSAVRSPGSRSA